MYNVTSPVTDPSGNASTCFHTHLPAKSTRWILLLISLGMLSAYLAWNRKTPHWMTIVYFQSRNKARRWNQNALVLIGYPFCFEGVRAVAWDHKIHLLNSFWEISPLWRRTHWNIVSTSTWVKKMVNMAWDLLLVSFMLVEAVVLFVLPLSISSSISL